MPSLQHEQWKQDLFDHLDCKLSGCISCEFGESRDKSRHSKRLELPARVAVPRLTKSPNRISKTVLSIVKKGPPKRTRTSPTRCRTVPPTTTSRNFCRYWETGMTFSVSQLPLTLV